MTDAQRRFLSCVLTPTETFTGESVRLLRAVRFMVSKNLKFETKLLEFMQCQAESLFQKNKDKENKMYRKELKKMFEDQANIPQYINYLITYGLIPSQPKMEYLSEKEKTDSNI